jgi:hypothetical protein
VRTIIWLGTAQPPHLPYNILFCRRFLMIKLRGALQGRGEGFPLFADYLARARSRQNLTLQNTTAFGSVHFADLFRSSIHAADRSARWQYSAMLHTATFSHLVSASLHPGAKHPTPIQLRFFSDDLSKFDDIIIFCSIKIYEVFFAFLICTWHSAYIAPHYFKFVDKLSLDYLI